MISAIICTYNRCDSLRQTLESFSAVEGIGTVPWELLVIDNNSKDATQQVISGFTEAGTLPLRGIFESRQGLSNARNRGIEEAKGDVIAFVDDDVLIDRHWLVNLQTAYNELGAACIGGKILPHWEAEPPCWLGAELHGHLALLDLGDERIRMQQPTLWGANLTFRADVFKKHGLFDAALGRIGGKLYGNEEIRVLQALIDQGEPVYYCPEVLVHHCVPESRLKKKYFRKWFFDDGELKGLLMGDYSHRSIRGIPLYELRHFVCDAAGYIKDQLIGRKGSFLKQLYLVRKLGFMSGRVKYMKMQQGK